MERLSPMPSHLVTRKKPKICQLIPITILIKTQKTKTKTKIIT